MEQEQIDIVSIISVQNTLQEILKIFKQHEDRPELILAGMEALFNIADVEEIADILIENNIIAIAYSAISRYDYNVDLLLMTVRVLVVLSNQGKGLSVMCGSSGERLIVLILIMQGTCAPSVEGEISSKDKKKSAKLVVQILKLLCNCFSLESNRMAMKAINGVSTILDIMQANIEDMDAIGYCIATLSRLCSSPDLCIIVAEKACHQLIQLAATYIESTIVVSRVFELLGQMALVPVNMKAIVQHGGVKLLLDTMTAFSDNEELMISAIATLDNIIIVDEEYSNYVIEKGKIMHRNNKSFYNQLYLFPA